MIFRETTQVDLDYMAENSVSRGVQKSCPEQLSYMYSLEHEGKLLGVGGFILINPATAWCWMDISGENYQYWPESYMAIKKEIDIFAKDHNLRRLQAYVECDFPKAISMIEHLGFTRESTMKNFIGDKDAYMYIRIL